MARYDYTSMGFFTYDCLGWPFTEVPPGGGTVFIDELTLAVSGAGGTAAIAAAKMGLKTLAVAGVGDDLMGDWVLQRLQHFGVDTWGVQRKPGWKTSSSIVTTRADGSRPALHMKGATANFFVDDSMIPRVVDTKVFHAGGVGLMDAMDKGQSAIVMKAAKAGGARRKKARFLRECRWRRWTADNPNRRGRRQGGGWWGAGRTGSGAGACTACSRSPRSCRCC